MRFSSAAAIICLPLALGVLVSGCAPILFETQAVAPEAQVNAALSHYSASVMRMDPSEISDLFAEQGSIAHETNPPIIGRKAIRQFFESFAAYKVVENDIHADSTVINGNLATQTGSYRQAVTTPTGSTVQVSGTFRTEWQHKPDGPWLIQSMRTASAAS